MEEYVKGPEPDRWHWMKTCKQYPRVALRVHHNRPTSDLCDDCLDLEKKEHYKIATV